MPALFRFRLPTLPGRPRRLALLTCCLLLLGLGVRTLSVGAARVPQVATWIAATDTRAAAFKAAEILAAGPER